jgi:hypothetical protein
VNWFGESWLAPACDPADRVETPIGLECAHCDERIVVGDRGVFLNGDPRPFHFECFIRGVIGSVGHQKGSCPCYGGVEDDPPGATRREAARAAMEYFEEHPPEPFMEIRIPEQQLKDIARVVRRVLLGLLARHQNN